MSSAQKVPAWKRLGLKLKQPASGAEIGGPAPAEGSKPNGQQLHDRHASGPVANAANASPAAAAAAKRKRLDQQAPPASSSPFKRTRTDDSSGHATPTLRKQKSVTFADDVKNPTAAEPNKKSKGPKKEAKTATQQPTADIKPSLEYLRNWKSSRETWKFNKNHQTILMKRVFHADAIPSSDIASFYEYIQDLKGFTRTRLKETAAEVKKEDTEKGKAAFPEGTPDMDSKQSEYEEVLAGLMQLGSGSGSKRKRFDEPGFVSQSTDVAITQRVIKRMRAETILEELSDSDDSDAMTVDTDEASSATQEAAAAHDETVDKRIKLNDGTKQTTARRRKRRTNVDSSSESSDSESESESESDSDSDSDNDSDDSDNASEIQRQAAQREVETSSESSSSSEDEDSSSEDDSEEEEETTKQKGSKK
ncbi:hypothetical protein LY78DRAFT_655545 [Colletotrichum sublineola]|uniref:WKF domain-containing protein n=1 Tax=Colletotrichum sublineola TaxID=1173701 RepID=A0A066XF87_COLSU|nr:hypothetical protein LY78DRAFT_655545 [Colletotrichum sublineola]KDN66299.1 hypothetical protein CSUB01_03875 [Colletotrichum sublineola]